MYILINFKKFKINYYISDLYNNYILYKTYIRNFLKIKFKCNQLTYTPISLQSPVSFKEESGK